jgi:hypothetical protein
MPLKMPLLSRLSDGDLSVRRSRVNDEFPPALHIIVRISPPPCFVFFEPRASILLLKQRHPMPLAVRQRASVRH